MHTKKLLLTLFFFFSLLAGCGLEAKTLSEFYGKEFEDVTKIEILNGSTGYKKIVTDKKVINDFLSELKDIQFIPDDNQDERVGFLYSNTLFQGENITFSFSPNEIDDHYYYTEPDINPIIDSFYENLKVAEE